MRAASGGKYIGGIVGYAFYSAEGTLELSELYNTGSISGSDGVGGILGYVTIASSKASPAPIAACIIREALLRPPETM